MSTHPTPPYKLTRTLKGKLRVKYSCPFCKDVLENELAEAGQQDTCPTCAKTFTVPGEAKRKEVEANLHRKLEEKRLAEQRESELAAEQAEADQKSKEALRIQKELQAQKAAVQREEAQRKQLVTASNTEYFALRSYVDICRVVGWACIIFPIVITCIVIIASMFQADWVDGDASAPVISSFAGGAFCIAGALLGFPFFVAGQLIQLALDARNDLAKLVEQKRLDG